MSDRRAFLKYGSLALPTLATPIFSAQAPDAASRTTEQWYWYPGHDLTVKAGGKETGNTCAWVLIENSPRQGVPFHKHLYEDESFYVIAGVFEITVGDQTVEGGPGMYMYGPRNLPHRWTNVGSVRGRLLNVFTPAGIEKYFLSVAIPIARPEERPAVDVAEFQSKTSAAREKFGIVRTGPLKYPNG